MGSQNFEQMMNIYHGIFVYCGIAALVFLVLAVALFILLNIPAVFSDLTGRGAKKAIQEMVDEGSATGNLASRRIGDDGRRHRKRGRTGALGTSRLRRRSESLSGALQTEAFRENVPEAPVPMGYMPEPEAMGPAVQTAQDVQEDTVNETTVLDGIAAPDFVVLRSIVEIHTEEVISRG